MGKNFTDCSNLNLEEQAVVGPLLYSTLGGLLEQKKKDRKKGDWIGMLVLKTHFVSLKYLIVTVRHV